MTDKIVPERSSSPFKRLLSLTIRSKEKDEKEKGASRVKTEDSPDQVSLRGSLSGIVNSISNNRDAKLSLDSLQPLESKQEIARVNEESSEASVRDVEAASELARKLAEQIARDHSGALSAIQGPTANLVASLLK